MDQQYDPRRYLFFKIFIWFWLTLIATITLLILLSHLTPNQVDTKKLKGIQLKNIQHLAHNIERMAQKRPDKSLLQIISHRRLSQHKLLYVYNPSDSNGFFNRKEPPKLDINLLSFSKDLPPQRIITKGYYARGPIALNFHGKTYQLYELEHWRSPPFSFRMMLMPTWLKILVGLIASLGLSLAFSKILIKPINALKNATSRLAKGELSARVETSLKPQDEINQLATDFNAMANKIELLMSSQKRLLADVSHELRSPLTRLQMATGLAQLKQTPEIATYLERIEQEAINLDGMIASVLQLSRLEVQSQQLCLEQHNVQSIIEQVINNARFEAEQNNKQITLTGNCNVTLNLDAALIASAIENIVRNAIKYANHNVTLNCQVMKGLVITIKDDGVGVDPSHLDRLFEPFYRVSDSRQRNTGGTGLGLAISKHAIEAHGGSIELASNPNQGLKVKVTLPIASEYERYQ